MSSEPIISLVPDSHKHRLRKGKLQEGENPDAGHSSARVPKLCILSNKQSGVILKPPGIGSRPQPWSVAGHVSPERNRVRMAEAAPSNSSQQSSRSQQTSGRRRRPDRQNSSNNRNDGSDSEPEERDDDSDNDTGTSRQRVSQRRRREIEARNGLAALSREEMDRIRHLQTLTGVGSEWDDMRLLRQHNIQLGVRRVQLLILRCRSHMDLAAGPSTASPITEDFVDNQSRLRQTYLDHTLYEHIKDKHPTFSCADWTPDHLEGLVQQAELEIIQRCRTVDPYVRSWTWFTPKTPARLSCIVKNLYSDACNYISALPRNPERSYLDDFVASCGFIKEKCCKSDPSARETTTVDPIVDSYFTTMVEELSEDVALDMNARGRRLDLDTLKVCETIQTSRRGDRLSPTYLTWAASSLDAKQKEKMLLFNQQKNLAELQRLMRLAKRTMRQEFCSNIVTSAQVSLVLFKDDRPSAIKDVAADELRDMGWVLEECQGGHQFVRLEARRGTPEGQRYIFKVSMDEEVLAMLGPDAAKREELTWEPIDDEFISHITMGKASGMYRKE